MNASIKVKSISAGPEHGDYFYKVGAEVTTSKGRLPISEIVEQEDDNGNIQYYKIFVGHGVKSLWRRVTPSQIEVEYEL